MKSAERYRYEANCNHLRSSAFIYSTFVTAIFTYLDSRVLKTGVGDWTLLATSGTGLGTAISNLVASYKDNRSSQMNNFGARPEVLERHFFTRRKLYRRQETQPELSGGS